MEEKLLKLAAQLTVIGVGVWVVASAMGKGAQMTRPPAGKRRMNPRAPFWRNPNPLKQWSVGAQ